MTQPDPETRVLVVDDEASFRAAMVMVVECTPGFVLVGEAASGEEAITACSVTRPDLVLMDINLPGLDGIEATRRLLSAGVPPVVLLLSTYDEDELDLTGSGAAVYLPKSALGPDRLQQAWADATTLARRDAARPPQA